MGLTTKRVVTLGHAVCSESGGKSGTAGNQSGKELRFQEWYLRAAGWSTVFRAKKSAARKIIAAKVTEAVNNKHVGYSQTDRTSLYREALNNAWDISGITVDCNTDCSALCAVCANAAGIKISKDMYSGNAVKVMTGSSAFTVFTSYKYTKFSDRLIEGDVLLGPGHMAIVAKVETVYIFDRVLRYVSGAMMTGDDVKLLQTKLRELGYYTDKLDGIFGMNTESAVSSYQKARGLSADGEAGPKTIASLGYTYGG